MRVRTTVGIVGAGPAGLMLGRLLDIHGIDSVVLERQNREYVTERVRAGVLEHPTVDLLKRVGLGERLLREGMVHEGLEFRYDGEGHRIDFASLTGGKTITVYGQREVVKDLIDARLRSGSPIIFQAEVTGIDGPQSNNPTICYRNGHKDRTIECDFVVGCDGFQGISRTCIPSSALHIDQREYPFSWLGILAEARPSSGELIYASHQRGFALHSMRSETISRNYFQCPPGEDLSCWPDDKIWDELDVRMETTTGFSLTRGPIIEKGITAMRSFVVTPMQHGRLFLAGDAAHIVPPTGAKGMNLAIYDVGVLANALYEFYDLGTKIGLQAYSENCLKRVWRVQHFSWWLTAMLHVFPNEDLFTRKLQRAQLEYVCSSEAAARSLAENYVGLQ
jgi:p-hydroxybenzoate 3-monooxygenase